MPFQIVNLLQELIATPSVNPRLDKCESPSVGEGRLTERLATICREAGWRWGLQQVHPGRANLVAFVPGGRGDVMLWDVHQDTVATHGMTIDPLGGCVRDGRVYGRGACDVKGGMAAMLTALSRTSTAQVADRPSILFASTVNEECGFTGARALARLWPAGEVEGGAASAAGVPGADAISTIEWNAAGGLTLEEVRHLRPASAIVAEPTELDVVVAHRGVVRWRCLAHGRAVHSSAPERGANAIYAMASVVQLIQEYHRDVLAKQAADPLCGPPTACVTTIQGGSGANTVPDRAVIDVDRRLLPTQSPDTAVRELIDYLARRADLGECTLEHEPPWMQSHGLAFGANRGLAEDLVRVVRDSGRECRLVGVPYGANAASIAATGIPTVVFGPGSVAQAHTADEWIAVDQLEAAAEILTRVAAGDVKWTQA